MKQMTFFDAIKSVFKNYANFRGRARRTEFWFFYLLTFIIEQVFGYIIGLLTVPLMLSAFAAGGSEAEAETAVAALGGTIIVYLLMALTMFIISLVLLIPSISVSVRRLHDTGRSGWCLLIGLIPLIGAIVLLVWYCTDSQPGENQWGANPKEDESVVADSANKTATEE